MVEIYDTDITNYIVEGTYNMNAFDSSESWEDGNFVEHRIIVKKKVSGSFDVVCSNRANSITVADFLALWNSAVNNGVVTIGVDVLNEGVFKSVDAYYSIENKTHDRAGDGSFIDVFTISIKER